MNVRQSSQGPKHCPVRKRTFPHLDPPASCRCTKNMVRYGLICASRLYLLVFGTVKKRTCRKSWLAEMATWLLFLNSHWTTKDWPSNLAQRSRQCLHLGHFNELWYMMAG
jgi:hypothetical protein